MNLRVILTIVIMSLIGHHGMAQDQSLLTQLKEEEQSTVEAIALYPENERIAILTASTHPEVLVRIQNMQAKTVVDFRNVIDDLDEEEQKRIFNLARYPDLVSDIVAGDKKKTSNQMDILLTDYPEGLHEDAKYLNKKYFFKLRQINQQYLDSQFAFENMISDYPANVREAYRRLLELPELMGILSNNLNMTVLLGDYYKKEPEKLLLELDSLNLVVAEQKAKELEEWKQTLENNPEAKAEYEQVSREFGREQGYAESDYSATNAQRYSTDLFYYGGWHSYSYWFGCPIWYPYDCWYPYPWWYHCGFYYGPGNVIVYVGIPSSYYVYWHYHNYAHLYNYPHFTNTVISYHQHHPTRKTNISSITDSWVKEKSDELPKNWFNDDADRVKRIKEYGKFNMDYQALIGEENSKIPTRREYLESNANTYPTLKGVLKEKEKTTKTPLTGVKDTPVQTPIKTPVKQPNQPVKQQPEPIERPQSNREEIERAKKHHENTWSKPTPQPRPVQTKPPTRTNTPTPTRTPVPKKTPVRTKPPRKN